MKNNNIFLIICNIMIFLEDSYMVDVQFQKDKVQKKMKYYIILTIQVFIQVV